MPGEHALLSASSAARWLACTRAPRMEERYPETESEYAAEGTLAHAIAELKVRRYFTTDLMPQEFRTRMSQLKADAAYKPEMESATEQYLDYLKSVAIAADGPVFVAPELRVDYGRYAPEGFGTADCSLICPPVLYVVDYKNGSGVPVSAEHNPQMMLYALGVLEVFAPIYGGSIQEIHLTIVQPHAGGVKEWRITRAELETWGTAVVRPRAELAWQGEGDFAPGETTCRFCRAKALCRARAEWYLSLEPKAAVRPVELADSELGDLLTRASGLVSWASDLKDHALKTLLAGGVIPGYKAVEGRSSRAWMDTDRAFTTLQERGVPEALLWERKAVTPPALQKALGKKQFDEASKGLVVHSRGKPTLAPETDKRPAYNAAEIAFGGVKSG